MLKKEQIVTERQRDVKYTSEVYSKVQTYYYYYHFYAEVITAEQSPSFIVMYQLVPPAVGRAGRSVYYLTFQSQNRDQNIHCHK